MKWVYTKYKHSGKDHLKPSCCHPYYHKVRNAHMIDAYSATIEEQQRINDMQIDFGMICKDTDSTVEVKLGKERILSCWLHQVSNVLRALEKATEIKHKHYTFYKFGRWPGVICFISKSDRRKVIKTLTPLLSLELETEHNTKMYEGLVHANARGDKKIEPVVRKVLKQAILKDKHAEA